MAGEPDRPAVDLERLNAHHIPRPPSPPDTAEAGIGVRRPQRGESPEENRMDWMREDTVEGGQVGFSLTAPNGDCYWIQDDSDPRNTWLPEMPGCTWSVFLYEEGDYSDEPIGYAPTQEDAIELAKEWNRRAADGEV